MKWPMEFTLDGENTPCSFCIFDIKKIKASGQMTSTLFIETKDGKEERPCVRGSKKPLDQEVKLAAIEYYKMRAIIESPPIMIEFSSNRGREFINVRELNLNEIESVPNGDSFHKTSLPFHGFLDKEPIIAHASSQKIHEKISEASAKINQIPLPPALE